jgi:asparagine synthase (glutamine-hydrolysing)
MRILAVISTQLLHRQFVVDGGEQATGDAQPAEPMTIIDTLVPERSTA